MLLRHYLLTALAVAPLAQAQPAGDRITMELAQMQGVWRLVGFEVDGKDAYLQDDRQPRWVIKGNKVHWGGEELATLTLDPATAPKCLDLAFVNTKRVHEGIYQLDKDRFKICVGVITEGVKERPPGFDTKGIDKFRTLIFTRDKAGNELEGVPGFVGVQLRLDDKTKEVVIELALKGSPAEKAGFKKDDVILKVGDSAAEDLQQTVNLVRQIKPGSDAVLRIRRAGKEEDIKLKVGVAPFGYLD
jgi:uncharacterized protein (TIGR03067 family)